MRKYLLANFILLYLREASKIWEVARKLPGSRQEVARKSPGSCQEVARKLPGSCQEVTRKSPGSPVSIVTRLIVLERANETLSFRLFAKGFLAVVCNC
jgi:hypothetical protein